MLIDINDQYNKNKRLDKSILMFYINSEFIKNSNGDKIKSMITTLKQDSIWVI